MTENGMFISCEELERRLQSEENLFIFDCSWELESNFGYTNWSCKERIPTSYFLNVEMGLNGEFQDFLHELGIENTKEQTIVLYDYKGMWSVAKAYWMFLMLGFENVKILHGGFVEWKALGFPIETIEKHQETTEKTSKETTEKQHEYNANMRQKSIANMPQESTFNMPQESTANILQKEHFILKREYLTEFKGLSSGQIIDLRSSARFKGIPGSEPRPNCPAGHIPDSLNIPYSQFLSQSGQFFLSEHELEELFASKIGNHWKEKNLIFSCGSGITACIGFLAALKLGKKEKISVYSGSWIDYCRRKSENAK